MITIDLATKTVTLPEGWRWHFLAPGSGDVVRIDLGTQTVWVPETGYWSMIKAS